MPEPEDIEAQLELLRLHRRNLVRYLQQQAEQGGSAYVTPSVANGIVEARAEIAQVKSILRGWSHKVDDLPSDMSTNIATPAPPNQGVEAEPVAVPSRDRLPAMTTIDPDGLEGYFTDVEHLREAFRELVAAPTLPKRLLVIHGVGGAGKSSLLRMFRIHARRASVPIGLASGDEVKSVIDIIAAWSDDLQAAGVRLPSTTKTLARYRAVQTTVERQAHNASSIAGKLAVKTVEGVAGSVAGAAIGSVFPVVGTVAGAAVGALVGTSGEAFSDWLGTFLKRPDIELVLDPTRELSMALLADLDAAGPRQRIVLLLDTFEQLSALEDWARDFAQRLQPNILLVIAGRAVPGWGRAWPGWLAQARVEELKPMTPEIMRELIRRYYATMHGGEPDPKQVEAIISFARGLPVVVTSAVQLWVAYGVEDFQSVKSQVVADLVDRLLEGVPHALVPMLEAAATLRWFNKELLRIITQQNDVNTAFDDLRRFPFIRPRAEGLALHDAVREIIDESLRVNDPARHCQLHEMAAAYFGQQPGYGQGIEKLARERLYHSVRASEQNGIRLFAETAEQLVQHRLIFQLRNLVNDVHTFTLQYESSRLWRDYFTARLAHFEMRLNEADTVYQRIGNHAQSEPTLRAFALRDLGNVLLRSFRLASAGGKDRAARVLLQALDTLPDDVRMIQAMFNLCGVYAELNQHALVTQYAEQAYQLAEAHNDHYGMVLARENLRTIYGLRGDWLHMFTEHKAAEQLIATNQSLYLTTKVLGGLTPAWVWAGRYAEAEDMGRRAIDARQRLGDPDITRLLKETGYSIGMQGRYIESEGLFARSIQEGNQLDDPRDEVTWIYQGQVMRKSGRLEEGERLLRQALSRPQVAETTRRLEALAWLGEIFEVRMDWTQAADTYQSAVAQRIAYRQHSVCAALTGLVRVKHAQGGNVSTLGALLAEAEALAQQYEYNDHLASLRLTQAQLAWDGALPELGRGFDAALGYYQQALIYALRYNRFLLDEVLWGGGVCSPLKPIVAQCQERTFEGQRMLAALRDWWQSGANDIGVARPDSISPIPEGIPLLEAERIAREREPGDGMPQRTALEQLALHL